MSGSTIQQRESSLAGRRVMLVGKLASMSRRDAERLIREHGGQLVDRADDDVDLIVVERRNGRCQAAGSRTANLFDDDLRARIASGEVEARCTNRICGLAWAWSIRGTESSGCTRPRCWPSWSACRSRRFGSGICSGALASEARSAAAGVFRFRGSSRCAKLAQLLHAGCSLSAVNRQLETLSRLLADSPRPLADPAVVVEGRRLFIRRGEGLAEPTGQLLD